MQLIEELIHNIQLISAIIIVCLLLFGLLGIYLLKVRRSKVVEKAADYSSFERKDTLDYTRFDDIREYMVVDEDKKRFIGAIKCEGSGYEDAEVEQKLQIIRGYITFHNVLDNQCVQYRLTAREVDLSNTINSYKECMTRLNEKRFLLQLDYEALKQESEKEDILPEDYDIFYTKLRAMQRELISLGYQVEQLQAQISYAEAMEKADPYVDQIYVFDWSYNKLDFTSDLSEAEIYAKAERQLKNKAEAYINALRNAGVKAEIMTGVEILEEIRRYTHPISAAKYKVEDIVQSAYDSIAVTSTTLQEMERRVNEKVIKEVEQEFSNGRRDYA